MVWKWIDGRIVKDDPARHGTHSAVSWVPCTTETSSGEPSPISLHMPGESSRTSRTISGEGRSHGAMDGGREGAYSLGSNTVKRFDGSESLLASFLKAGVVRGRCRGSYVHPEALSSFMHVIQGWLASHLWWSEVSPRISYSGISSLTAFFRLTARERRFTLVLHVHSEDRSRLTDRGHTLDRRVLRCFQSNLRCPVPYTSHNVENSECISLNDGWSGDPFGTVDEIQNIVRQGEWIYHFPNSANPGEPCESSERDERILTCTPCTLLVSWWPSRWEGSYSRGWGGNVRATNFGFLVTTAAC